jgi:hypothetical protein
MDKCCVAKVPVDNYKKGSSIIHEGSGLLGNRYKFSKLVNVCTHTCILQRVLRSRFYLALARTWKMKDKMKRNRTPKMVIPIRMGDLTSNRFLYRYHNGFLWYHTSSTYKEPTQTPHGGNCIINEVWIVSSLIWRGRLFNVCHARLKRQLLSLNIESATMTIVGT